MITRVDAEVVANVRARARQFVNDELIPLEPLILRREASWAEEAFQPEHDVTYLSDPWGCIPPDVYVQLLEKAKERGLWGLDAPIEYGGQELSFAAKLAATEELGRTVVPFVLAPDSPNFLWLKALATPEQFDRYVGPVARGEITTCIAISEEEAGSDVAGMRTTAHRDGNEWVLDGRKKWIGWADTANVMIVVAVTDQEKGAKGGMTAFLVDRGTPGVVVERRIAVINYLHPTYVRLEGVRVGQEQVLGSVGNAFVPLQNRLGVRRLELAARSAGGMTRVLELMVDRSKSRVTFGEPLADRQTIQNWIADIAVDLHKLRLVLDDVVDRVDAGREDVRFEVAMTKLFATEAMQRASDLGVQLFGGDGLSKDYPLEHFFRNARVNRITEGTSEIQRRTIARHVLTYGVATR